LNDEQHTGERREHHAPGFTVEGDAAGIELHHEHMTGAAILMDYPARRFPKWRASSVWPTRWDAMTTNRPYQTAMN